MIFSAENVENNKLPASPQVRMGFWGGQRREFEDNNCFFKEKTVTEQLPAKKMETSVDPFIIIDPESLENDKVSASPQVAMGFWSQGRESEDTNLFL